jgi:hypothetical protein
MLCTKLVLEWKSLGRTIILEAKRATEGLAAPNLGKKYYAHDPLSINYTWST